MEAIAKANHARFSSRKVNQVCGLIRGKSVAKAFDMLPHVPRACGILVFKTLKSAYANSGASDPATIYVKEAWANIGPALKRVRPMAMGARSIYKRKTCHLTIRVTDQQPKKKK
ncbi:MAG: 50S ribosomal protein L22 [Elusimicrobia bacterium]|nr:50S ribosomal protein L22 [Elusimicrobiota bacterium]